jgi:hypothetical protein
MTKERFYEKNIMDRLGSDGMAGDLAESKVEQVMAAMDRPVHPFGPRRVPMERGQQMTWDPIVRHMPDYLGWGRFIEVQGSNGTVIIFKDDKLRSLEWWDGIMPVFMGIYLQAQDEVMFCDLPTVRWAIAQPNVRQFILDENTRNPKLAWEVPVSVLTDRRVKDAFANSKKEKK